MRLFLFLALVSTQVLLSCRGQRTTYSNYLERIDTTEKALLQIKEARIQKNDLLSIKVYSQSADPRTDIPYNLPEPVGGNVTGSATSGFLVDEQGTIEYPRLGLLQVEGLTKAELAQQIREKLDTVLKKPSVIVRFLNYRVTVLGEVRRPGTFTIPTERVTVLEALGLAGDISEFGQRDTVKIAREVDGKLKIGYIGLKSADLFTSPYYQLQQNDVIFVAQTRRRIELEGRQAIREQIGIATGIITAVAIILNIIR